MVMEIETLQNVLNVFLKDYWENPIQYFYEEDIRADLLNKLRNENVYKIKLPLSKKNQWLKDYYEIYGENKEISGIKAEYPSNTRFDIAYINPINLTPDNCLNHYILDCIFAIEIKLSQKDNNNSGFKSDIKELNDYKILYHGFTGIALNFEQNPNYDKEKVKKDYNNFGDLLMEDKNEIQLLEGTTNYFFISPKYIIGGFLI